MSKKILLISYHFPPSTEVGGQRIANFAKRLPRFGWNPYVLTVKDRYLQAVDPEKLKDIDQAIIFKAGHTPTLSQIYLAGKKTGKRLLAEPNSPSVSGNSASGAGPRGGAETLSMKLRRYVLSFLSLPDADRSWILPAVFASVRAIRRENIGYILTSCPPYSTHMVGLMVKWITGVRWIADFRDPWMTSGGKGLYATCMASLAIDRWMERTVVRNADRVIANTELLHEGFERAYSSSMAERFICITNGFDSEFFSHFAHLEKEKIFTITYTGSLYFGRTPEPIFQAVNELIRENLLDRCRIRIRLIGQCQSVNGRPTVELIEHYGLSDVVEVLESVSYKKAIEMIKQSHLALLLAPDQPYQIPAKVYDYMGVGTRVLALAKEGATANLVQATKIGAAFNPSDVVGIKGFIHESLEESETSVFSLTHDAVTQYNLNTIASRLADELDRLNTIATASGVASQVSNIHQR